MKYDFVHYKFAGITRKMQKEKKKKRKKPNEKLIVILLTYSFKYKR